MCVAQAFMPAYLYYNDMYATARYMFSIFADFDETKRRQNQDERKKWNRTKWNEIRITILWQLRCLSGRLHFGYAAQPNRCHQLTGDISLVMILCPIILFHFNKMTILSISLLRSPKCFFCRHSIFNVARVVFHLSDLFIFHICVWVCLRPRTARICLFFCSLFFYYSFLILVFNQLSNGFCWLKKTKWESLWCTDPKNATFFSFLFLTFKTYPALQSTNENRTKSERERNIFLHNEKKINWKTFVRVCVVDWLNVYSNAAFLSDTHSYLAQFFFCCLCLCLFAIDRNVKITYT